MHEAVSMAASRIKPAAATPASLARRFADALRHWRVRRHHLGQVAHLNDHMLADIGLTRGALRMGPDRSPMSRGPI